MSKSSINGRAAKWLKCPLRTQTVAFLHLLSPARSISSDLLRSEEKARRRRSRRIITGSVAEHFEVVVFDTCEQNSLPATLKMVVHKPVGDVREVTQITCIQQLLNTRR